MTELLGETFEEDLAARLQAARRIAIVGIGDELHPADRLGMLAAREVEALHLADVLVVLAGTTPESFTAPVRRFRPDHILLIDSADLGARPGTLAIVGATNIAGERLSTHALPLSVVMEYLESRTKASVTLVGIQPDLFGPHAVPTPAEQAGLTRLVACLQRTLSERPKHRI